MYFSSTATPLFLHFYKLSILCYKQSTIHKPNISYFIGLLIIQLIAKQAKYLLKNDKTMSTY